MRGTILAIAPDGTYGQIAADDGQRYSYWTSEIRNGPGRAGQAVDFQMQDGQPIDIFILPPASERPVPPPIAPNAAAFQQMPARVGGPPLPSANYWLYLFGSPFGRISRRQFWLHGVLPIVVVSILLGWIPVVGQLIVLATFWGSICICFKRFHDLGYAGWWCLINFVPMFAAMVIAIMAVATGSWGASWTLLGLLWIVSLVIFLVQLFMVYVRVGQPGANQYGPDPLAV